MNFSKNLKILLAIPVITSLSSAMTFASSISTNNPNTITQEIQSEAELLASTSTSSWTSGSITDVSITDVSITDVSITKNDTKYKDSYLVSKIKQDSFSAKFTVYSDTGKLVSSYPKNIRTLYGSASPTYASTSGTKTSVTYKYVSSAGDYEANVTVSYNIN